MISKIAFIGGDLRMPEAARYARSGCTCLSIYGFDNYEYCYECFGLTEETSLEACLFGAEVVVLGLPCSFDNQRIYAPYCSTDISFDRLVDALPCGCMLFGGKLCKKLEEKASAKGIRCFDYFNREELTLKNAMVTAEGAIQTAMTETPHTIHGSKCLVIGYGRIGKLLADMLGKLNAKVCCSARKKSDLALIECNGFKAIYTANCGDNISQYDIIFNTVPGCVLPVSVLEGVRADTLIIDLASKPGGVDFENARKLGLKVIWATSLPGKVAPRTSGQIIADTVFNIISEYEEVKL